MEGRGGDVQNRDKSRRSVRRQLRVPYGADHNVAMLVSAAAMARDFTTAGTYAMSPGLRHGAVDAHAGLTSGFYPASALVMYARFGEWERIRAAADNAELHRAPLSKAYVDANPQGTTNAERWTWRVAASPWGRAWWVPCRVCEHADGAEPENLTNAQPSHQQDPG